MGELSIILELFAINLTLCLIAYELHRIADKD